MPMPNPKHIAALLVASKKSELEEEGADLQGVEMAMEDFLEAADKKDARGMAEAFEAAFREMELQPHEEGEGEE